MPSLDCGQGLEEALGHCPGTLLVAMGVNSVKLEPKDRPLRTTQVPNTGLVLWGSFGEVISSPFVVDYAVREKRTSHLEIYPRAKPVTPQCPLATWRLGDRNLSGIP